jgi:spermidine synthase
MFAYAVTVFLEAFLLFQIQPLIGKYILPWFGGAPAVWSTCLLFFQIVLLGGYLYAHGVASQLSPRAARVLHVSLLLLSLLLLAALSLAWGSPILAGPGWKPTDPGRPVERILTLLAVSVGLPYLLLSSTSPLLQAWAARTHPSARVYRLYALSNLGSLLALVSYPTLVERYLPLRTQSWIWAGAYAAFAAGSILCAPRSVSSPRPAFRPHVRAPLESSLPTPSGRLPYLFWLALAFAGSMMLLATTNQMCQEVASIPFLWVLPLSLYLLSFVICFENDRLYARWLFGPMLVAALGWAGLVLSKGFEASIRAQIGAYSTALFAACMVLHGELARSKPEPRRLTSFYLTVAAGGAGGGIFVALIAPKIFRLFLEFHVGLVLTALLAILALARDRTSWLHRGYVWPALAVLVGFSAVLYRARRPEIFSAGWSGLRTALSGGPGLLSAGAGLAGLILILRLRLWPARGRPWFAGACLMGGVVCLAGLLVFEVQSFLQTAISVSRNFYGVLTVEKLDRDDPEHERLDLRNGRIVHGFQYVAAEKRREPTSYYTQESGIGLALRDHPRRAAGPLKVGVVGLGTGTIATYGRSGDTFRFYDINPAVVALSLRRPLVFTYLSASQARIEIVEGDARLSLERELERGSDGYDVLAVDAFSSDAIPVHLLTREMLRTDLAHLAPGGILAIHISNRQLNLEPVVRALANASHLSMCVVDKAGAGERVWGTSWVLLSKTGKLWEGPAFESKCSRREQGNVVRVWTDDYSNLFQVLK